VPTRAELSGDFTAQPYYTTPHQIYNPYSGAGSARVPFPMRAQWRSSSSVTWDQSSGPDAGRPLQQTSAGPCFSGDATVFPEVFHPIQLLGGHGRGSQFHSNQANTEYFQTVSKCESIID